MTIRICAALICSLIFAGAIALAQQPQAQNFVYNLKLGSGAGSGMDLSMAFAIQSTAADGTRQATVLVNAPKMPPLNGKKMGAAISPAGAITIASTGDIAKHYSPTQAKAMSEAAMSPMVQMMIDPLNTFALACASAPSLKVGTSWHSFWNEGQTDVNYTVTGREQRAGRDTAVVTISTPGGGGATLTGTGNYDPAAHMVVSLHSEIRQSATGPAGQVTDVTLANP